MLNQTWVLIHKERAAMADTLAALTPSQWAEDSLVSGWSVQVTAAHIVNGAENACGKPPIQRMGTPVVSSPIVRRRPVSFRR